MADRFIRTQWLLGEENMNILQNATVAVFGVGGVGGYAVEALARSGIGRIDIVDFDTVDITNLNRQIIALEKHVGRLKVEVAKERILEINPQADVRCYPAFYAPENAKDFPFEEYDYIVDAIDNVTGKLELIQLAKEKHIPIISSMGAGNKLDATAFQVADISKTSVCPLAKVMRRELKKRGIGHVKVVYSQEKPIVPIINGADITTDTTQEKSKKMVGSIAFIPSVVGLIIAGEVIKDLIKGEEL